MISLGLCILENIWYQFVWFLICFSLFGKRKWVPDQYLNINYLREAHKKGKSSLHRSPTNHFQKPEQIWNPSVQYFRCCKRESRGQRGSSGTVFIGQVEKVKLKFQGQSQSSRQFALKLVLYHMRNLHQVVFYLKVDSGVPRV